jgi:hypothetical protein
MGIMGIMRIMRIVGIMGIMADMVISAITAGPITVTITTLAATTTKTSTAIRIAGESIAVITATSATIIVIFTVIGDIGTETISPTTIGPMTEAIMATSLQDGFTPTRRGGLGLVIAKRQVVR